ncbi:hypothetical protein GJAV_G00179240 [Gymnothorax javanicus]|nr:hypothetical protein GJAV_G00179240 [Gymnothorax javanicus]
MMAVRERAVAVMAALDRRVPSLDDFVGQCWSSWVERANVFVSDAGSDSEECGKNGKKKKMDTMTLQKEDMSVFGHYPAHDDFYLVLCSHCGQVVKPQAFENHCERRHGPLAKLHGRLHPSPSAPPSLRRSRPLVHGTSHTTRDSRHQAVGPPRAPLQPSESTAQLRHGKSQELPAGHSPPGRVSQATPPSNCSIKQSSPLGSPPEPPPSCLRDPPWPHGATPPGVTSPSEKPLLRRSEQGRSPNFQAPVRGTRAYRKTSRKECDPDKHCGVLDPERKVPCTRLLTCNIHSIHQRRKVPGRSKGFDQLVAELKMGSKVRECLGQSREGTDGCLPTLEPPTEKAVPPHCRRELGTSTVFSSRPRTASENAPEEERMRSENQDALPLSPPAPSRFSSEESEGEGQEEPLDWHSSPVHPKPLALCSFGSRAIGRGIFTFDRRLHHLRSALSAMVEHHLSAHLWRKTPQSADFKSQHTSVRTSITATGDYNSQHSTVRTAKGAGNHSTSSFRTSSSNGAGKEVRSQNCSPSPGTACGPSESSGGGRPVVSPLPAKTPSPSGPGRPRNPVGRPSKQQLHLRQADHVSASRKRRGSPHRDASPSPCHDRTSVSQATQGRLPISGRMAPSPHGPINGSLSPAHKPRTQSEPRSPSPGQLKRAPPHERLSPNSAPRARGDDSGVHSRATSYDHKGRKYKSSGPSPPKIHQLPSSSHSGFFPWKDGAGGGLSAGAEKRLSTQKPKLHH